MLDLNEISFQQVPKNRFCVLVLADFSRVMDLLRDWPASAFRFSVVDAIICIEFPLCCWTDTSARLTATKAVAADANTTAIDVLERLGELNLHLHGLQRNYSELEETVNAANQMIQDPEKNSEILFLA